MYYVLIMVLRSIKNRSRRNWKITATFNKIMYKIIFGALKKIKNLSCTYPLIILG